MSVELNICCVSPLTKTLWLQLLDTGIVSIVVLDVIF